MFWKLSSVCKHRYGDPRARDDRFASALLSSGSVHSRTEERQRLLLSVCSSHSFFVPRAYLSFVDSTCTVCIQALQKQTIEIKTDRMKRRPRNCMKKSLALHAVGHIRLSSRDDPSFLNAKFLFIERESATDVNFLDVVQPPVDRLFVIWQSILNRAACGCFATYNLRRENL